MPYDATTVVRDVVREFQGVGPPNINSYYKIVEANIGVHSIPNNKKGVLYSLADAYYRIITGKSPHAPRGDDFSLVGGLLDIIKEAAIDMPLEILTGNTSDEILRKGRDTITGRGGRRSKELDAEIAQAVRALGGE